jgi:hypothetical protein
MLVAREKYLFVSLSPLTVPVRAGIVDGAYSGLGSVRVCRGLICLHFGASYHVQVLVWEMRRPRIRCCKSDRGGAACVG